MREDYFVVGPTDRVSSSGRCHRRDFGDGRERRIVRRGHVHFHYVADRQGWVKGALQERARPAEMSCAVLGRWLISVVKNRNFTVFFYVVVTWRPVLHFLLDELVQRTVAGYSAHRIGPAKSAPEQRFPDDRDECDGEKDECERHRKSVGQLNAQRRRVPAYTFFVHPRSAHAQSIEAKRGMWIFTALCHGATFLEH